MNPPNVEIYTAEELSTMEEYFTLVTGNKVEDLKKFLKAHANFDINCVNSKKVSALYIALDNKADAMVDYLLGLTRISVTNCIVHALRNKKLGVLIRLKKKL